MLDEAWLVVAFAPWLVVFEPQRQMAMLYLILCGVVGGPTGAAAGMIVWVAFGVARFGLDMFGFSKRLQEAGV